MTRVEAGARPEFRAARRASVPFSNIFFFCFFISGQFFFERISWTARWTDSCPGRGRPCRHSPISPGYFPGDDQSGVPLGTG
jgi:hypothetical protein